MSMSMNIHNAARIVPSDIYSGTRSDGEAHYWRNFDVLDNKGINIFCISIHSDNGYNLLIDDAEIAALNEPVLKVV